MQTFIAFFLLKMLRGSSRARALGLLVFQEVLVLRARIFKARSA